MRRLRTYHLLDLASIAVIFLVVFIVSMFLYMRFWPVDVIKDSTWKLTVSQSTYHAGDTIPVHVVSDKIRRAGSHFTTTAECKNDKGLFVTYIISESNRNAPPGHVETSIDVQIPGRVIPLPTTCRIAFILEYQIYSFRSFPEYNFTNEFTLIPRVVQ